MVFSKYLESLTSTFLGVVLRNALKKLPCFATGSGFFNLDVSQAGAPFEEPPP